MDGGEVAVAAITVLGATTGGMVWLLKKLFNQNDTTIKQNNRVIAELTTVLADFKESFRKDDIDRREFQKGVVQILNKVSDKQDVIYEKITATDMTVQNLYVMHENIDCSKQKSKE